MNQDAAATAYYEEIVTITLSRLQLLALVGASVLALKHPDIPNSTRAIVTHAIRDLEPLINKYAPADTLNEWAQALKVS